MDLWAKGQQYNLHNVNWFMMPNGDFILNLKGKQLKIPAQNEIGETILDRPMKMQEAFDFAYQYLLENYADQKYLWDLSIVKKWGKSPVRSMSMAPEITIDSREHMIWICLLPFRMTFQSEK